MPKPEGPGAGVPFLVLPFWARKKKEGVVWERNPRVLNPKRSSYKLGLSKTTRKERTMKKLQILGTGCAKCNKLAENTETAAKELGIDYELLKVQELDEIMKFGVMVTPALAVDGTVKITGKVPKPEEIKKLIG
jgi:small redox-active disulfide protein 2